MESTVTDRNFATLLDPPLINEVESEQNKVVSGLSIIEINSSGGEDVHLFKSPNSKLNLS